jgi:hypothetical protein
MTASGQSPELIGDRASVAFGSNPAGLHAAEEVRNRRVSPIAARPGEGRLTQARAGARPGRREPLYVPHSGHRPT